MDAEEIYSLAKRRGFFWPSFEIYGGAAGFFDYGPLGALLKANIEYVWRRHYVVEEGCAEISCPNVAIEDVFRASGHLEEFSDLLVTCSECRLVYRADHLLDQTLDEEAKRLRKEGGQDAIERAEAMENERQRINDVSGVAEELKAMIELHGAKCLKCKGALTDPEPFNLMFKTQIGPGIGRTGYLRPETAQAMFMNFGIIYKFFREKLPFGIVQIGNGFRNEISPRQGLFRMREFNMMEAEVFFDPEDKAWPGYDSVREGMLPLFYQGEQKEYTMDEAVKGGIIANKALAHFMHLTKEFLLEVGIDPRKLRFRQHGEGEIAHYASDCWDAEIMTSMGWIETVGIADRGEYDVGRHIQFSGADLRGLRKYAEPKEVEVLVRKPVMKVLGPKLKELGASSHIKRVMDELESREARDGEESVSLSIPGHGEVITLLNGEDYALAREKRKLVGDRFVPHVIEPSYGLDRILYSVVEHAYNKEGEYTTLKLKPAVAPYKVGVFPLMAKDGLDQVASELASAARDAGLISYYDEGGSIGRRYARMDEIGTPYCITIDYQTMEDGTVTIRERDTKDQVRVEKGDAVRIVSDLIAGKAGFADFKT